MLTKKNPQKELNSVLIIKAKKLGPKFYTLKPEQSGSYVSPRFYFWATHRQC